MNWAETLSTVRDVLNVKLFELGGTTVTPVTALTVLFILLLTIWLGRATEKTVQATFAKRGVHEKGTVGVVARLLRYGLFVVGFGVALSTSGINLGGVFAAGAVFAVGIGFAMQNIAQNFVSGIILLLERTIKPGDTLEIEGHVVRVTELGIRATIVRTRDDEDLVVPNSILVQTTLKNFTLRDPAYRVRALVGVIYASDMNLVQETLEQMAAAVPWRLASYEPRVLLLGFGDSSVNFDVSVWVDDPFRAQRHVSELNKAVWWALKEKGIVIAFPQVDVHLDPPVMESLAKLGVKAA
jgi:small-conductance mechanosensitive channel